MSTILKALQRLERERQAEPDRSLRDELMTFPSPREPGSRSRLLPVLIGLVLGAGVGGALIWFLAAPSPTHSVGGAAGPEIIRAAPDLSASQPPAPLTPTPPRPAVSQMPEPVLSVDSTLPTPSAVPEKPITPHQEGAGFAASVKTAQQIKVRLPIPLPELVVRKTVWHPNASRRVAILSIPPGGPEQEVHEGDFLGSLVVLEITPSSVLFGRDGVELRKRVGE